MSTEPSLLRLYVMRSVYLLNFVVLGMDVWPSLVRHDGVWEPMRGVAFSFWAALATISALGLRAPLRCVPILLFQCLYKVIWLVAVAMPNWSTVGSTVLATAMSVGLVVDLVAIPWPYVVRTFVTAPGDRWKVSNPPLDRDA